MLTFAKGGSMRMPLLRIERVVDDEVVPEAEKSAAVLEATALDYPVRFVEGSTPPRTAYGDLIFAAARRHKVNPDLVAAVIRAESAFHPRALSNKGARGLMQLMPATAKRYGVRSSELFLPERNIEAGVRYLAFLADRFADDLPKILAGYNAGEGTVARYGGVPPYRETQSYVRRILGFLGLEAGGGRWVSPRAAVPSRRSHQPVAAARSRRSGVIGGRARGLPTIANPRASASSPL